jgi:DNA-binding NtrC family response regulator
MAHMLIIDDDDQLRTLLRQTLEREGYTVGEAQNGREGMARYRATPADLVITNILMPKQEGLETIRVLRQESPEVKTIAIAGGGRMGALDFLDVAARLGARRTLRKLCTLQELGTAVCAALQHPGP